MGSSQDPEQQDPRHAKREARAAARQAKAQAREEAARQRVEDQAAAAFWGSPQGQARSAYQVGQHFFQIELPIWQTQRSVTSLLSGDVSTETKISGRQLHLLELIEAEGWRLENVGYVFQQTGAVSRDKFLSSGQTVGVTGEIVGIYLFRRAEQQRRELGTMQAETESVQPPLTDEQAPSATETEETPAQPPTVRVLDASGDLIGGGYLLSPDIRGTPVVSVAPELLHNAEAIEDANGNVVLAKFKSLGS